MIIRALICFSLVCLTVAAGSVYAEADYGFPDEKISISFTDADLRAVFSAFADRGRINIVLHPHLHGKITVDLRDISIEEAFKIVLRMKSLYAVRDGGTIIVYPLAEYLKRYSEQ